MSHPQGSTGDTGSAVDQVAELLMGGEAPKEEVSEEVVYPDTDNDDEVDESEVVEAQDSDEEVEDLQPEESHGQETDDDDGLAALAAELGLDSDKLTLSEDGDVLVKLKVNGKDQTVDLKEAIAGTQYSKANEEKARVLAEERKSFESEREQVAKAYEQQLRHVQGLGEMLQNKLTAEYQSIDWQKLRVTDPAEYVAKQYEFQQRSQELQQAGTALGERMRIQQEEQTRLNSEARAFTIKEQKALMIETVPAWSDEEKMKSDLLEIVAYAKEQGFEESELSDVIYNRHLQMLRKAMMYDRGQSVAEKKVRKAPKMQRASNGRFVSKKESKVNKLVERAQKAKGANKREAQADAVAALLLGG